MKALLRHFECRLSSDFSGFRVALEMLFDCVWAFRTAMCPNSTSYDSHWTRRAIQLVQRPWLRLLKTILR